MKKTCFNLLLLFLLLRAFRSLRLPIVLEGGYELGEEARALRPLLSLNLKKGENMSKRKSQPRELKFDARVLPPPSAPL
jgi:hypothetical protein